MKTILVAVVGTVGLLSTPAVAGKSKKPAEAAVEPKLEAKKLDKLEALEPLVAAGEEMAVEVPMTSPELLALPMLPADPSSALTPFPELERGVHALAKAVKPKKGQKAPTMNLGAKFVLGGRTSAQPHGDVEHIIPKSLSSVQVSTFIDQHLDDIHLCWSKIPAKQRVDACTARLQLTISEQGTVTDVEVGGDVPAAAQKCIIQAVTHWQFPAAETSTETEYGISLRSL